MVMGVVQQVGFGISWGSKASTNLGLMLSTLIPLGMLILMKSIRMETVISESDIHMRFFPFITRVFPLEDIQEAYVRESSPIREFGGWGIRWALTGGMAYNVSGKHGLQLVLKNGKKVFLGTQKPRELQRVIDQLELG